MNPKAHEIRLNHSSGQYYILIKPQSNILEVYTKDNKLLKRYERKKAIKRRDDTLFNLLAYARFS